MSPKKWSVIFLAFIIMFLSLGGLTNILIDPFGVFGDPILDWYSYNMTNNPRVAKIAYLDKNYQKYDSYIIGSSKTSSISTDILEKNIEGSKFYNLTSYGGDLYDIEKTANYVINNYNTKRIIINLGLEEAVSYNKEADELKGNLHEKLISGFDFQFYLNYIFLNPKTSLDKLLAMKTDTYIPKATDIYIEEKGIYNKIKRDSQSITNINEYYSTNKHLLDEITYRSNLYAMDLAVDSVKRIKELCDDRGVEFTLIMCPISNDELEIYDIDEIKSYWIKLSEATEFWDFSGRNSISGDLRYFYDKFHFRNYIGDMIISKIYEDNNVYSPKDFGRRINSENVGEMFDEGFMVKEIDEKEFTKDVPILLYHEITEDNSESNLGIVTLDKFEKDMLKIKEAGYETIFFKDLENYVYKGTELPDKPILITFDDGYQSNYDLVFPLMKKHDMKSTISIIGVSIGREIYKDTDYKITPHFDINQAKEMQESGYIDIQNHSYDMHQVKKYDGEDCRIGVLINPNESEEEYISYFKKDAILVNEIIKNQIGGEPTVFAYPYGLSDELSEILIKETGIKVTLSTVPGINTVVKGLPQSLGKMKRISVTQDLETDAIMELISTTE